MNTTPIDIRSLVRLTGRNQLAISDIVGVTRSFISRALRGCESSHRVWAAMDRLADVAPGTAEALARAERDRRRAAAQAGNPVPPVRIGRTAPRRWHKRPAAPPAASQPQP